MNKAQLIGHVGKDPEIRTMQGGGKVASFSVATPRHARIGRPASGGRKPSGTASSSTAPASSASSRNT